MIRSSLYVADKHVGDYTAGTGSGGGSTEYRLGTEVQSLIYNDDENGNLVEGCLEGPFGEALTCNPSVDYTETHFADQKRDAESNLDYMGARFYNSTLGRFMSPDPSGLYYANPANPQSLNLYSYGQNNPLTNTDPTGLDCVYINNDTGGFQGFNSGDCNNSTEASANSGYYVDGTVNQIAISGQNQVIGYGSSSGDGQFDSFAGSSTAGPAAAYLNPYTQDVTAPGQSVNVNANDPSGPSQSPISISSQIPLNGIKIPIAELRAPGTPKKLSQAEIQNYCAIAAALSGGGTVPGGNSSGSASSSPSGARAERSAAPPNTAGPGPAFDAAANRTDAYTNLISVAGTAASCYAAVSAAQR